MPKSNGTNMLMVVEENEKEKGYLTPQHEEEVFSKDTEKDKAD